MPLNDKGEPCENVGLWEEIGIKKVPVGVRKVKRGRGFQEVVVYDDQPIRRRKWVLIPAEERGWHKEVTWEYPRVDDKTRVIDIVQYNLRHKAFHCPKCRTNDYIRLRILGHDWDEHRYLKHKGSGIFRRCFGCDHTTGPVDPVTKDNPKGTERVIKRGATKEEAFAILKKYGLDFDISLLGFLV